MIRRVVLLCLWTLIVFPDYLSTFSYKTSTNLLTKEPGGHEDGSQNRAHYHLPGKLFLNDEDDDEQEMNNSEEIGRYNSNNNKRNLDSRNGFGGDGGSAGMKTSKDSSSTELLHLGDDKKRYLLHHPDRFSIMHTNQKRVLRRRKGPTLSVVNPLEILRQRLMLEMARRRIQENQQQIVANADFLENLGKRSAPDIQDQNWSNGVDDQQKDNGKMDEYSR